MRTSSLAIALLCVALFTWDFGQGALLRYGQPYWSVIRLIGSSAAPAFLWHFVLVFTGRDRSLRAWLHGMYALTGIFAARQSQGFAAALAESDEVRQPDLGAEALPGPLAVAARLVAQLRVHQITGPMFDAVDLPGTRKA